MTSKTHGSAGQVSSREMAQNATVPETWRTGARAVRDEERECLFAPFWRNSQDDFLVQGKA